MTDIAAKLKAPFPTHAIHWRVGSTNAKKLGVKPWEATKGLPLAYIDARDVMDRLDSVVGAECWQDRYVETPSGRVICTLSIDYGGQWIEKSDGAGDTGTEGEKGAISDAFKRAAVKHGIGRYLYSIKSGWIDLENGKIPKNWLQTVAPKLLAAKEVVQMHEDQAKGISNLLDGADLNTGDGVHAFAEAWLELDQDEQKSFAPWISRFYPGGVSGAKEKMRAVLAAYREGE